jgi:SAM-dependent methyltransferase
MEEDAYHLMAELDDSHWWFQARREIVCDVVRRFVPSGSEVVDYGCGTGAIAARLREAGYRVVGAEVSEEMLGRCELRGVQTINLGEQWIPPASADCVLACDVLEHVEHDVELLVRLRDVLRPEGLFIATVPAYEFLWSGEDYVSRHFRRYTRRNLRKSFARGGYDVVWSSYFNTLLFPTASLVILTKRLFRPRAMYSSNVERLPPWQNSLFRTIFTQERALLRHLQLPFGLSVMCVARADAGRAIG